MRAKFKRIINDKSNLREVRNISLIFSAIVSLLVFVFLMLFSGADYKTHFLSVFITFIFMMTNSYIIYLILKFSSFRFTDGSLKYKFFAYSLAYGAGILLFVCIFLFTLPITDFNIDLLFNKKVASIFVIESFIFTTLIILFQNFILVQTDRNKIKLENANLKTKSAEAVNLLLKQQMHPHFLFNSLHTIKVLYKDNPELGENYLVYLADFLRTTISESHSVSATVEEEIKLLENYLKMQQMRFENALQWEIKTEKTNLSHYLIPAFSLQPLAENAIKHNHFSEKNPLLIFIEIKNGYLKISNNISKKKYTDYSVGTGLMNISERYFMWCGEDLEILDDGNYFSINFKLEKV